MVAQRPAGCRLATAEKLAHGRDLARATLVDTQGDRGIASARLAVTGGPAGGGADSPPQQGRTARSYLAMSSSRGIRTSFLDSVLASSSAQSKAMGVDQEAHARSAIPKSRPISYGQISKSSAMRIRPSKSPRRRFAAPGSYRVICTRRVPHARNDDLLARLTRSTTSENFALASVRFRIADILATE